MTTQTLPPGLEEQGLILDPEEKPRVPPEPASTRPPLPVLDGVRGVAILVVMLYHFAAKIDGSRLHLRLLFRLIGGAWCGVDLFFVLSGFLITGILWDTKGSPGFFRRFYLRRLLRIFPLYYGVLMVVFGLLPLLHRPAGGGLWIQAHQGWFWAYGTNLLIALRKPILVTRWYELDHLWSLAVEEHFYLFWPVVVFLFSQRGVMRVAAGMIVLSLVCRLALYPLIGGRGVYVLTPCRLDGLLIGALLALHLRGGRVPGRYRLCDHQGDDAPSTRAAGGYAAQMQGVAARQLLCWSRPLLVGSLLVMAGIIRLRGGLGPHDHLVQLVGYPMIALASAALITEALASRPGDFLGRVLGGRFLGFLGKYSYGLYIYHVLLRPLFVRVLAHLTLQGTPYALACFLYFVFGMATTTLIAWVSYELYERRFLQLKERIAGA